MSQAAVASPAQADTTQFDMSSAVPETEDGKAVSAMPAFDLSSAMPEDQISRAQPKSWEDQVLNFITAPFRKSPEDRQAEAMNIYAISKSTGMSMEDVSKNYDQLSRNPKVTGIMPEPTKGQVIGGVMMEGMLAPVSVEGGIAAGALLTAKGIAGLGVFTGINALVQYGKDKLLPQDTNQGAKNAIDLAGLVTGGIGAHVAGEALEKGVGSLVDSMVGNIMPHAPDAVPTMDLAAGHIKAITDSKLPDDAKQDLLGRLGVTQDHIDASVASGKPIRVPFTNVLDMAQSPHWDDIAGEITENGLPKTGIETPEVKEMLEGKKEEIDQENGRAILRGENVDAVVAPSPKEEGKFQTTILQKDGSPSGDSQRDTFEEALEEARNTTGVLSEEQQKANIENDINPRVRPKEQPEWTDDEKNRMGELREIVSGWKAGGDLAPGKFDNGRMIRLPSSFGIKNQGLTQRDLTKLFDRFESGKPLTNKQIAVTKMLLDYHKGSENLEEDITNATKDVSESEAGEAKKAADTEEPIIQPALDEAWSNEGGEEVEPPISPMTGGLQEETGKFGEGNKLFTEAMANKARESLSKRMSGSKLHDIGSAIGDSAGALGDMLKIGGYHFEGGVREFGAWSTKMISEFGDAVKPHLQDIWDKIQKQAPKMAQPKVEATEDELAKQKYFPLEKLGIKKIVSSKTGEVDFEKSGDDMRERYLGAMNERTQRVFDLRYDMKKIVKDEAQQEACFIYASNGGDVEKIRAKIAKADALPADDYNKEYWEKKLKPAAVLALNPTDEMKEIVKMGDQYYKESGLALKKTGAIRTILENYGSNRLYEDEPADRVLKGNDYDNPQQSTGHAKQRYYEDPIDAAIGGKRFKTINYPDLIGIHGEEAASITVGRQLIQESVPDQLLLWTDRNKVPAEWGQIGNMERDIPMKDQKTGELILDKDGNQDIKHQVLVGPKAIADRMGVITDPDNLKKMWGYNKIQAVNNFTKSFNVMIGLFHDKNFLEQKLFSPGGIKALANTFGGNLKSMMETPDRRQGMVGC